MLYFLHSQSQTHRKFISSCQVAFSELVTSCGMPYSLLLHIEKISFNLILLFLIANTCMTIIFYCVGLSASRIYPQKTENYQQGIHSHIHIYLAESIRLLSSLLFLYRYISMECTFGNTKVLNVVQVIPCICDVLRTTNTYSFSRLCDLVSSSTDKYA